MKLPPGMTPRLLSRVQAAAYCGVVAETFDTHVAPMVKPVAIGARRLWDVRAIDAWLDQEGGLNVTVTGPPEAAVNDAIERLGR